MGKKVEPYIDDMVVKSKEESKHLTNLGETFAILRRHKLHLNVSKFSFGVGSGKFFGLYDHPLRD